MRFGCLHRARLPVAVLLAGLGVMGGAVPQAAQFQVAGTLEFADTRSVSVRIGNGEIIDALATEGPQMLPEEHAVGDWVVARFQPISPVWDEEAGEQRTLQAIELSFPRPATASEQLAAAASLSWRNPKNRLRPPTPPPPSAPVPADPSFIAATRRAVLDYIDNLPNYTAHESVLRSTLAPRDSRPANTRIESDIALTGIEVSRSHILFNGAAWAKSAAEIPGLKWNAEYANHLASLFSTNCPVQLTPDGTSRQNGMNLQVIRFSMLPDTCAPALESGYVRFFPGMSGRLYINPSDHLVLKLEESATAIPARFPIASSRDTVTWEYLDVPGGKHLLEASSELVVSFPGDITTHIRCAYSNYHAFAVRTRILPIGHPTEP